MNEKDPLKDLQLLIHSRYCVIFLDTAEEERAETLLKHLADSLRLPFFSWTPTKGLRREAVKGPVYGSTDPSTALTHIEHAQFTAVYHFQNLGDYLEDRLTVTKLKDAAMQFSKNDGIIVITGHDLNIPDAIKPISAMLKLPEPKIGEYKNLLNHIIRDINSKMSVKIEAALDHIKVHREESC